MKKRASNLGFLLGLFFTSCTFESDIKVVDKFYDGYMIVHSKIDTEAGSIFVRNFKEDFYETVVKNCKQLTYDSSKFYISTKDSPEFHYNITISMQDRERYLKTKLDRNSYEKAIRSCKKCLIRNY